MDDLTRRRLEADRDRVGAFVANTGNAIQAGLDEATADGGTVAIQTELEKLGIPADMPASSMYFMGVAVGMMMSGGCTLEERLAIVKIACAIDLHDPYDCTRSEINSQIPAAMYTDERCNATDRYMRIARIAHAELVYALEEHYDTNTSIPISELSRRATDAFLFQVNLFDQIGISA